MTNCQANNCTRKARCRYIGSGKRGRGFEEAPGRWYCKAHYERARRGKPVDSPVRYRAPVGKERRLLRDVASICEARGAAELAQLFRNLKP